jgi:hypothetical protein
VSSTRQVAAWPAAGVGPDDAIIVKGTRIVQQQWFDASGINVEPDAGILTVVRPDGTLALQWTLADSGDGLTKTGSPPRLQMRFENDTLPPGAYVYELRAWLGTTEAVLAEGLLYVTAPVQVFE